MTDKTEKIEVTNVVASKNRNLPGELDKIDVRDAVLGKSMRADEKGPLSAILALRTGFAEKAVMEPRVIAHGLTESDSPELKPQAVRLIREMEERAYELGLSAETVVYWLVGDMRNKINESVIVNFPDMDVDYEDYDTDILELEDTPEAVAAEILKALDHARDFGSDSNWVTEKDLEA